MPQARKRKRKRNQSLGKDHGAIQARVEMDVNVDRLLRAAGETLVRVAGNVASKVAGKVTKRLVAFRNKNPGKGMKEVRPIE